MPPRDLKHHTLIHVDWAAIAGPQPDWAMCLRTVEEIDGVNASKGPVIGHHAAGVFAGGIPEERMADARNPAGADQSLTG